MAGEDGVLAKLFWPGGPGGQQMPGTLFALSGPPFSSLAPTIAGRFWKARLFSLREAPCSIGAGRQIKAMLHHGKLQLI
jgi:hypothetical protein